MTVQHWHININGQLDATIISRNYHPKHVELIEIIDNKIIIVASSWLFILINLLTPNVNYSGRTATLTSKVAFLYIYSTNICTEYFKHGIYSPSFSLQNAVCFIILTYLVAVLFTFYVQGVLKLKKNNSGAKRLRKLLPPVFMNDRLCRTFVGAIQLRQCHFSVLHLLKG